MLTPLAVLLLLNVALYTLMSVWLMTRLTQREAVSLWLLWSAFLYLSSMERYRKRERDSEREYHNGFIIEFSHCTVTSGGNVTQFSAYCRGHVCHIYEASTQNVKRVCRSMVVVEEEKCWGGLLIGCGMICSAEQ